MTIQNRSLRRTAQQRIAIALCCACPAWSQQASIEPVRPSAPILVRPYMPASVPPVRVEPSGRIAGLVRAGMLYLTAQDAIALALENNIDIEIGRYGKIAAAWQLQRAEAGGALPGVPSTASQAGSVAAGQGVAGSQAAAGVGGTGANANSRTANATITQIGPVTQNLDPAIQQATTFSHTSVPQPNLVQSFTPALISNTHVYTGSYQQGFLTGGAISVNYSEHYLKENSPTDVLNPSVAPVLSMSAQHNLLRGFGLAANGRTITVAKMNLNTTDLTFKTQVIGVFTRVLNFYYGLAAAYDDLKAKKNSADVADTFYRDVKAQVEIGSVAPPELISAEALVVSSRQAMVDSQTSLDQQELSFKNLISRTGAADPALQGVQIVPVDRIAIPEKDDLAPVDDMVKQALASRSDLASEKANEAAAQVSSLGTKNGVLPNLQVFTSQSHAGLAGTPRIVQAGRLVQTADPYFAGGIGTALGEVFRLNFPSESVGAFYQEPMRNRQALADYAIDQLQLRQTQLTNRKDFNQVQVDVLNYVVALRQARVRYDAAVHNRILQEELFTSEQTKFRLGASTPYNVVQQQRDLITAQSAETAALVAYSTAKIALEQTLGTTLEVNHISIAATR